MKSKLSIIVLLAIMLFSSCGISEREKQKWYDIGYRKGLEDGIDQATGAFVKDSWKPTLGLMLMVLFGGVIFIPVGFTLHRRYELHKANARAAALIYSAKGMQFLTAEQGALLKDLDDLQDIHNKTYAFLKENLIDHLQVEDEAVYGNFLQNAKEAKTKIADAGVDLKLIRNDIEHQYKNYQNARRGKYRLAIKAIRSDEAISPTDKMALYDEVTAFFNAKISNNGN